MTSPDVSPDYRDIQCLLRSGLGTLRAACHLLLRIEDAPAAGRWLAQAPLAVAEDIEQKRKLDCVLQIALSAGGLTALGLPEALLEQFSPEFLSGMAGEESRSRRLGDIEENDPAGWQWGAHEVPHVIALLFASTEQALAAWATQSEGELSAHGFSVQRRLDTSDHDNREPFGFTDGISQPEIDWKQKLHPTSREEVQYRNCVALGEFVLGYENEYGKFTRRPLLEQGAADLPLTNDPDYPGQLDLGKNGTYLVFRQLSQDVRLFWQTLDREAGGATRERQQLAEQMVGRRQDERGTPLAGDGTPDFTYASDPHGTACPFGAHIRRANPRNSDVPYGVSGWWSRLLVLVGRGPKQGVRGDLIASSRFHRLLRRGREYGPPLDTESALQPAPANDAERGINFIALGANIERQFEFVQNAWLMSATFDALVGESDPLLGNRQPIQGCPFSGGLTLRAEGAVRRRVELPRFVTMRGGAYFFLPGLRALRYFARCAERP